MNIKKKDATNKCKAKGTEIIRLALCLSKLIPYYFAGFSATADIHSLQKILCEYKPTCLSFNFADFQDWSVKILTTLTTLRTLYDAQDASPEYQSLIVDALKESGVAEKQQQAYRLHQNLIHAVDLYLADYVILYNYCLLLSKRAHSSN